MTGIANGLTLPNSLANGQTTDASLVMANYSTLLVALNRALLDAGGGSGMNAYGSVIHNLGAGALLTDAVNLGQLAGYLPLTGGTLTGALTASGGLIAPTRTAGDSSTNAATTAFVQTQLAAVTLAYAPLASPALTGTPTVPTAAPGTNTTQVASTAFTTAAIAAIPASGLGIGQTWQALLGSRADGTTYTNSTGKPIFVSLTVYSNETATVGTGSVVVGGVTITTGLVGAGFTHNMFYQTAFIVPNGSTYQVNIGSGGSIVGWAELR